MKILLTGSSGQLGNEIIKKAPNSVKILTQVEKNSIFQIRRIAKIG